MQRDSKVEYRAPIFVALIIATAIVRVVSGYASTAQGFDEPCHVAAAIELLDKHTYTLDPVHPPLSRLAIGLPLYLAGKRYPVLTPEEAAQPNYNVVGNHILHDDGRYLRNLVLARLAILPFLITASLLVYFWSRREFGELAAVISVLLFTTTPIVLALSSIAYTDLVTATTQFASLFAFTVWLSKPTMQRTFVLGVALGLAVLSKLTSLLFLPFAALALLACGWLMDRKMIAGSVVGHWKRAILALVIAVVILWGGYGFSVGHVREEMRLSTDSMPSFQHFPGVMGSVARNLIQKDPVIPAPALLRGFATAWVLNKTSPPAYLLGHVRSGGWWYFFFIGLIFKSPLPFLVLGALAIFSLVAFIRAKRFSAIAPAVCVLAILVVTMPVTYNAGLRHVIVIFPLLAMIAGAGAAYLWRKSGNSRIWMRYALIFLLVWQGFETVRAQSDFIAYFNELAGNDPSRIMVAGCDLDCGQDLFRLSRELAIRKISHLSLAVWSSADVNRMGLPNFDVLQPFTPATGWIALSARSLRFGDVLHSTYPPDSFAWLEKFHPVAKIGKTIWLYYIPPGSTQQTSALDSAMKSSTTLADPKLIN